SGLLVEARLTRVSGHAERLAALDMIEPLADRPRAVTLGADKGYDAADSIEELRTLNVRHTRGAEQQRAALDRRPIHHPGYGQNQRTRKRIEEAFGWIKTVAGMHLHGRRLQSGSGAKAADRDNMTSWRPPAFARSFAGRWRIVDMD